MGSFLGGLAGGISKGIEDQDENGSLVDRFKDRFGRKSRPSPGEAGAPPMMHKGGRVQKTGIYKMKKGEVVIPAKIVSAVEKVARKKVRKASRTSGRR